MKYETVKAGTPIKYMDEGYNEFMDKWVLMANHMIGLQVCGIRVRRPVAEVYAPNADLGGISEGDKVGPFEQVSDTEGPRRKLYKGFKDTHLEYAREGIYLVVNRKYEEVV